MSYSAIAWWCIAASNLGRWSFFIINVQPERRNLWGCLGGKHTTCHGVALPYCFWLSSPALKSPAGTRKDCGMLGKTKCQAPFHNVRGPTTCAWISCTSLLLCRATNLPGALSSWKSPYGYRAQVQKQCCYVWILVSLLSCCQHISGPVAILFVHPVNGGEEKRKEGNLFWWCFCKVLVS